MYKLHCTKGKIVRGNLKIPAVVVCNPVLKVKIAPGLQGKFSSLFILRWVLFRQSNSHVCIPYSRAY